jgi:hypothetical protein
VIERGGNAMERQFTGADDTLGIMSDGYIEEIGKR